MMIPERTVLERRVLDILDSGGGEPPRIPVLLGLCGSGRTSLLLRLRDLLGRTAAQYVDVEAIATTPERFLAGLRGTSPFAAHAHAAPGADAPAARDAFDASLAFLDSARASGGAPATFLMDEFLEFRTFESFPGLRSVLRDLASVMASSGNRFVLTTRYPARAHRLLRDAPARLEMIEVEPLTPGEVRATLTGTPRVGPGAFDDQEDPARDELARVLQALSGGRPLYARLLADAAAQMGMRGATDPVSALVSMLAPGAPLSAACRFCYELRLHRARGYGALKAILEVLAEQESLTLTEIAQRLRRTPGSTKDYLSWLEDVDLIAATHKRYRYVDPLLRLWARLHCRPVPPTEDDIAREVHAYVLGRLPQPQPAHALAGSAPDRDKSWGIIEID